MTMATEVGESGKVMCSRCPFCGQEITKQRSLAKHIRHGDCEGGER
jgi:hypothetical protein